MDAYVATTAERPVVDLGVGARARFIVRTYSHVFAALAAFTLLEVVFFRTGFAASVAGFVAGTNWLLILGAFMVVGWLARGVAHGTSSYPLQYVALLGFVAAEAVLFVPLLYVAEAYAGGGVIASAAVTSLGGFAGLTVIAMLSRKDFSFLGSLLKWVGFCALGLIAISVFSSLTLGLWFSVGMVVFAGAAILYDTSKILHHYPEDKYVAASLELFASVALLFWYVLQIFLSRD